MWIPLAYLKRGGNGDGTNNAGDKQTNEANREKAIKHIDDKCHTDPPDDTWASELVELLTQGETSFNIKN